MKEGRPRKLELLAPAKNAQIGRIAIDHGADAVYIGAHSFGARAAAGNSIEDIRELCEYAHRFRAKVYVTVNTIIYDSELSDVQKLIEELYEAGADALIVQDMGLLRLKLPPIELHASTQCDTRSAEKAKFLQEIGMSQIVLARELTLNEISDISKFVDVPLEVFVHGALCVSYSGKCHASQALCARSANRGECAQICRLPYTLSDSNGKILSRAKHLLSLHDFNTIDSLEDLCNAGASSFKIEGRLKDADYVKNVTAAYRKRLDEIIAANPQKYARASYGSVNLSFTPKLDKSFNRGFTSYFLYNRKPKAIASLLTPKSLGEKVTADTHLHNGDGLSFFTSKGEYTGFLVNGIKNGLPLPSRPIYIPKGTEFFRTTDIAWQKLMASADTSRRVISLDIKLFPNRIELNDERGCHLVLAHNLNPQPARSPQNIRQYFEKLGGTHYILRKFENLIGENQFIPASQLSALRRNAIEALDKLASTTYRRGLRRAENAKAAYPLKELTFRENVANRMARKFYKAHGVNKIEDALEIRKQPIASGTQVMTTRHCVLRELGCCLKDNPGKIKLPLRLLGASRRLIIEPDCKHCEMKVFLAER